MVLISAIGLGTDAALALATVSEITEGLLPEREPSDAISSALANIRLRADVDPSTVADETEERRKQWVSKRLTQYGRARAQSLGWPDVYTFTKAMGERAVEELADLQDLPLSIVRPSIIESFNYAIEGVVQLALGDR